MACCYNPGAYDAIEFIIILLLLLYYYNYYTVFVIVVVKNWTVNCIQFYSVRYIIIIVEIIENINENNIISVFERRKH